MGFFVMCVKAQFACGYPRVGFRLRGHAPRAGAGIYFLYEKKVNKDSPKGRVSILSPLEPPLPVSKGAAFGNRERLPLWFCFTHRHGLRVKRVCKSSFSAQRVQEIFERWNTICKSANRNYRQAALLRANESALKMPADGRKH